MLFSVNSIKLIYYEYSMQDSEDAALAELVMAMMKYGNAAKAYVTE